MNQRENKSLFHDKSTLILRLLLAEPGKKWVTRELAGRAGVSLGLVSRVLSLLESGGYLLRTGRGAKAYSELVKRDGLLETWVEHYDFSLNRTELFYMPGKNTLNPIVSFFKANGLQESYALTLHTGANLITSQVLTENIYLYLQHPEFDGIILRMADRLGWKKLARGGNISISYPYYRNSAFHEKRTIKGMKAVSNLQLFLDLYNFHPRGREHALKLKEIADREDGFFD